MKQWLRKVSSLFLASMLTVSLNGKAYAQAEQTALPETPPEIVDPAASEEGTIPTEEMLPKEEASPTGELSPLEEKPPAEVKPPEEETGPTEETRPV